MRGWIVPLGWDDIDTDPDPSTTHPETTTVIDALDIDALDIEIAADRLISGRHARLTDAERDQVVRVPTNRGHSIQQIAEALDISPRTVSRRRRSAGAA